MSSEFFRWSSPFAFPFRIGKVHNLTLCGLFLTGWLKIATLSDISGRPRGRPAGPSRSRLLRSALGFAAAFTLAVTRATAPGNGLVHSTARHPWTSRTGSRSYPIRRWPTPGFRARRGDGRVRVARPCPEHPPRALVSRSPWVADVTPGFPVSVVSPSGTPRRRAAPFLGTLVPSGTSASRRLFTP